MKPYTGFADMIRRQRKAKKLRLHEVAEKVGWSIPYLSELERGIRQPPQPGTSVELLAQALGLAVTDLEDEARKSRRSIEIDLQGADRLQRELALLLARRFDSGLSEEEAQRLIKALDEGTPA